MSEGASKPLPAAECVRWRLVYPADGQIHSLLLLIAAVIFHNGIRGDLTFDDHLAIGKNADAWADKKSLGSIFYNDFWGKSLDRFESNGSYRPITVLTFRIQHWLMGYRHSPAFLHGFNYTIAYLNVCLVFYLARLYVYVVVPSAALAVENAKARSLTALLISPVHAVPLMAALLFLVHPVHVDAVTSIVGRCELLYCLFGLIGFFCIHRYLDQVDETADTAPVTTAVSAAPANAKTFSPASAAAKQVLRRRRLQMRSQQRIFPARYVLFAAYALIISILCKDSGITFTAIYSVHACVMYACGRCQRRRPLLVIAVAVLELVGYIAFRRQFIGHVDLQKNPLLRQTENPQYFVPKGLFHWLSIRWVIQVKNLELLFFPTSLCCEYSFNCIPHMQGMQDPRVPYFMTVTGAALITLLGLLYGTLAFRSRVALVGLVGLLWMAISYAPVSHLFIAVGTFIAERCLYVPSIGAVLLITFIVGAPGLRKGVVTRYFYGLLLLCVGWGIFSHRRNEDWLTDERLFRSALRTCPNSGKAYSQLAALISSREQSINPEIVELANRSVQLDSKLRDGYYYLAVNEVNNNRNLKKAYIYLRRCMEDPFALNMCLDSYEKVRRILFPNMTEVETLVDYASLMLLESQKATHLRQAGVIALRMYEKPCLAQQLLGKAMSHWNHSQLYWISDEVKRESGDETYCNALYWYAQSTLLCETQSAAGTVESRIAEDKEDGGADDADSSSSKLSGKGVPLAPQEAAQRAVAVAERFRACGTDWHQVLSEPKYNLPTVPHRMTQYLTVGDAIGNVLQHYVNYTALDTPERNEVLLMFLDITVQQYCHIHTLMNDAYVRKKVGSTFKSHLQSIEHGFLRFRQERLADMHTVRRELNMTTTLNAKQQNTRRRILSMASCSSDLSFLAV
ncbi:hypothetical protein LMJF_20_0150 [Leishmania major strain Friedlin]|uniref:DUF1736 domain-containing protein n=1 Tax=Leishmania major TaxID=5664 RepID=Q4QD29_LEIMA|nr:hypothetical protein LMJF_20_0150 [Leishmania major strain Friedlin]CAG9573086.1 Domain_of_unknown_function_(DUF1736)_-_putative [Leishmania major strain Friedlin]CAJ03554.1 hypothetical protein LMJF_20_0150 [Leishmania major strain Friedlin]|eukprot:XP_001682769.1 hypothetical protein LMJF_20_0150 [Leishmania major strain Friedlin]